MTPEKIKELAKQAGGEEQTCYDAYPPYEAHVFRSDGLAEFASLIRQQAFEEAAKFIESGSFLHDQSPPKLFANQLAPKIRSFK